MKIIEGEKGKVEKRSGGLFIGEVDIMHLFDEDVGSKEFNAGIVRFPPGTRNKFHIHNHEQILYVIEGTGIVATEEEERVVTAGDTILFSAGENHWHGATKDSVFTHLYILNSETKTTF